MPSPSRILCAVSVLLLGSLACSDDGGLTPPPSPKAFVSVSAGDNHTCGVTAAGDAYC
jgi:hypothetical protein